MVKNTYWKLFSKGKKGSEPLIAELTPDGMIYIWPVNPRTESVLISADKDQDPEGLLSDGDFLDKQSFFNSIADFMNNSKYDTAHYDISPIGEFDSIRSCREALNERI